MPREAIASGPALLSGAGATQGRDQSRSGAACVLISNRPCPCGRSPNRHTLDDSRRHFSEGGAKARVANRTDTGERRHHACSRGVGCLVMAECVQAGNRLRASLAPVTVQERNGSRGSGRAGATRATVRRRSLNKTQRARPPATSTPEHPNPQHPSFMTCPPMSYASCGPLVARRRRIVLAPTRRPS
jgi:hypothetical protein